MEMKEIMQKSVDTIIQIMEDEKEQPDIRLSCAVALIKYHDDIFDHCATDEERLLLF